MKRLYACLAAVLAAAVIAPSAALAQPKTLSIATGTTGAVYFPLGGGLAQLLQKHLGINANVEATAGTVENLFRLGRNQADIMFGQTMRHGMPTTAWTSSPATRCRSARSWCSTPTPCIWSASRARASVPSRT